MEFIKRMKKREFIEMGLKTFAAIMAAFIAIILLEGMIFGITLNGLLNQKQLTTNSESTIAYAIEQDNGKYFVIANDEGTWTANIYDKSKAELESSVKTIHYRTPTAFELTIEPIHYVIMVLFVGIVGGYFAYRFVRLNKSYKDIVDEYNRTGTIEFPNL